jgi:hypothetical protein
MSTRLYDATVPVFTAMLRNMSAWLDKAAQEMPDADLVNARLIDDMRPLAAQYQMASDSAKNAIARLTGIDAPVMPDVEVSIPELQERCARTIAFIEGIDPAAFAGSDERDAVLKFPDGRGYRWKGPDYVQAFALPNFYFHAVTAYAIMRAAGVTLGKPDYLQHLGLPEVL